MSEPDTIYYLKSIQRQMVQLKTGLAYSRMRTLLGAEVLADNCDWLDHYIAELEAKKSKRGKL